MGEFSHVGITGAAGFIGSHLSRRLLDDGVFVSAADDLSFGSLANLGPCLDHPRFRLKVTDCSRMANLQPIFGECDAIVHLAARKIPRYGGACATLQTNVASAEAACTIALAEHALLVFASTSDVYGNAPVPLSEDGPLVLGPSTTRRWSYAASKLYGEHLALAMAAECGLAVTILRLFGSYGPHNHRSWWGGPQAAFIEALLDGRPMEIHGDGQQVRSFTYVTDVVDAIVRALRCEAARGQLINIGAEEAVTILELARRVQTLMGLTPPIRSRFISYAEFAGSYEDVRSRIPDTRKARALLGFEACVPLSEGLRHTIAWHRQQRIPVQRPAHVGP